MAHTSTFTVTGMHCPSCQALILDIIRDFPGVLSAELSYPEGKVGLQHEAPIDLEPLFEEIRQVGDYQISH